MWLELDLPVPDSVWGDTNIIEELIDRLPHRLFRCESIYRVLKYKLCSPLTRQGPLSRVSVLLHKRSITSGANNQIVQ
jgi:hypothetical protein